jgi:hypothetical protein
VSRNFQTGKMNKDIEDRLRAALEAPPLPPLDATRQFLGSYVADAGGMDEVEASIAKMVGINTRTLLRGLAGIEGLLAEFPKRFDSVRNLIACEIGWVLDDETDEGARKWLMELASILRRHLSRDTPAG